jgi:hypothetical protein
MNCVRVVVPAHLHAGNFDLNGGLGRLYGTVGFTIDYPKLVIDVEKAVGVEASNTLAERFAGAVAQSFGVTGFRVIVVRTTVILAKNAVINRFVVSLPIPSIADRCLYTSSLISLQKSLSLWYSLLNI